MSVMKWGLLWYEKDGTLEEKVGHAMARYVEKYDTEPNTCYVHPEEVEGDKVVLDGCRVLANPTVLRHHFWIGEAT